MNQENRNQSRRTVRVFLRVRATYVRGNRGYTTGVKTPVSSRAHHVAGNMSFGTGRRCGERRRRMEEVGAAVRSRCNPRDGVYYRTSWRRYGMRTLIVLNYMAGSRS